MSSIAKSADSALRPARAARDRYGFTAAEARVAHQLASGHRVGEVAKRLGISPAIARAHVRRLLAKTGARGLADLVRLILVGATPWNVIG